MVKGSSSVPLVNGLPMKVRARGARLDPLRARGSAGGGPRAARTPWRAPWRASPLWPAGPARASQLPAAPSAPATRFSFTFSRT